MIIVKTAHFMIKTKYYKSNNGTHTFQRRIPSDLRKFFDKPHITIKLTGKEASMAVEIARHGRDSDRLFADLRNGVIDPVETEALNILKMYDLFPGAGLMTSSDSEWGKQPHLDIFYADYNELNDQSEARVLAERLLTKPAPMTLAKVLNVYFQHHPKGTNPDFQKECKQHCKKILDSMGNHNIESISRSMVKDFILERVTEVKTLTVRRELSVIKAAFNVAIREKGLTIKNPFEDQTIPEYGKDKKIRETLTDDELKLLLKCCQINPKDAEVILLLCTLTGTRLSEIAGLRRCDIKLDEKIPLIELVQYGDRSLKTKNSVRDIPLVPLAVKVLKKHLASHVDPMAFPRYNKNGKVSGDSASATINKFIIRIGIRGKTAHCTRHTMRDLMRLADIPPYIIDAIQGWGSNTVGESYGRGYALEQKLNALNKALSKII